MGQHSPVSTEVGIYKRKQEGKKAIKKKKRALDQESVESVLAFFFTFAVFFYKFSPLGVKERCIFPTVKLHKCTHIKVGKVKRH